MPTPNSLPIDALYAEFHQALTRSHLVVESQTGSGKSTRLPLWAAETGRVLVVEPRRVACLALSDYLNSQSELIIGHAIRFESTVDEQTQVAFVTPGVALRWLSETELSDFDVVIIDEFHERRWDTDLLLALLKRQQKHKLILTSATIDGARLANYLGGERLVADGRQFDVAISYLAQDSRQLADVRGLESRVKAAVERAIDETPGDILVFLPGKKEIAQCQSQLKGLDLHLVPLHGGASNEAQRAALTQGSKRRVILATNVAETSLTIPGVTCVIDSGLERRTHQRNGRTVLGLHRISSASAAQRSGRAGRVQAGSCFRLWGQFAPMEALTPPEMQREELVEPMLAAACSGAVLSELGFVDGLPEKSLAIAKDKLLQMQAIDEQGRVTEHGKALYPLPIDTLFAHLITAMTNQPHREAMVDLASALSLGQRLWQPPSSAEGVEALKQWQPLCCDATTLIELLRRPLPEALIADAMLLKEARQLSDQIRAALALPQLSVATPYQRKPWLREVLSAQPDLAFVRRAKRRQALGNGFSEVQLGRDSRLEDRAEAAVVFDQFALPGKGVKQTLNLGTCLAPVTLAELIDAGIGQAQPGELQEDGATLVIPLHYAGREIGRVSERLENQNVIPLLVTAIKEERIFPGLYAELQQDIDAYQLWVNLGLCEENPQPISTPEAWLTTTLTDLGVLGFDDIELIEPQDLKFVGIPYWQRSEFDEKYPRNLVLPELKIRVQYLYRRKIVELEYVSGTRKSGPKRWELPRWNGWRVQYRKASKVVVVS
ncbi:helicase-related protein [Ferrimonas aestuarii]|uniref:ATP-dependent RNA helicase n=1 Tax=Ferrimonas aestuarii TaxID=2569539 RepID=A0A4U1BL23_9GAMM|nr:helicase-related protein [Ferrimonas aestuarii]TKB51955.1 ATP-dependent RNA helicase [Ferrimonas aestuarii]